MQYPLNRPAFAFTAERPTRSLVHEQAAALLCRYPDLSREELDHLVGLYPRLGAIDLSLMMADADLGPRLEAFCTANRDLLRPSFTGFLALVAMLAVPILVLAMLLAN